MTLRLEVYGVNSNRLLNKKLQIEVFGSKAGPLISQFSSGSKPQWKPSFRIDCSHHDNLEFILFELDDQEKYEVATSSLNCITFIKREKDHLQSTESAKYQLDLRASSGMIGVLQITINYEPHLLFQGEISQKLNLNFKVQKVGINFYTGKCETVNAFSCLDEAAVGQKFKFTESLYRQKK